MRTDLQRAKFKVEFEDGSIAEFDGLVKFEPMRVDVSDRYLDARIIKLRERPAWTFEGETLGAVGLKLP